MIDPGVAMRIVKSLSSAMLPDVQPEVQPEVSPKRSLQLLPALLIAGLFSSASFAATADRIAGSLNKGRNSGQTVTLAGNVHRNAQPQFDEGPVDPAMRLGTITLLTVPTPTQLKALTQLLAQQQDRKSSNYHKWLTPEQYADRFGLSANDMRQMAAWLKSQGFTMIHPARGRNWISFTGTAAQVQSAFGTEIHRYNVNGDLHYANATDPAVPAALGGIVTGLRGLHDFRPRPLGMRKNPELSSYARLYRARPYYDSSVYGDLVAPGDIATIYDINALYQAGFDGTGQKLAVMGQTLIYLSDLTNFRTGFGLSAISCTTQGSAPNDLITACNDPHFSYVLDGTAPAVSPGDLSEADLDLEWSGAVARGAQLIYVNSTDTFTSYFYAVDNNLAPVISLSYGECEFDDSSITNVTTGLAGPDETELMKANTEGITFVNSSGDTGAAECDNNNTTTTATGLATQGIAVSYPASSPEVTGVGGTAIPLDNLSGTYWGTSNGTDGGTVLPNGPQNGYIPEQSWNDDDEFVQYCLAQSPGTDPYLFCLQGGSTPVSGWVALTSDAAAQNDIGISSSGGGASNCSHHSSTACINGFTQPTWQTVSVSGQSGVRLSPDVSFLATPNFPGYIYCTELSELGDTGTGSSCGSGGPAGIINALNLNKPSIIGGTSASAPVFAGIVTLLNQYTASAGQGNVNPTLYSLAETPSNKVFHPVTTGENTVLCVGGQPSNQPTALQCPATGPSAGVLGFQASNADATTGYNLVTGLGSVDANNLAVAWAATLPSGFTFTPTATSFSVAQGSSVDAIVTVAMNGGFTGPVSFTCTDPAPESTCTAPPAISATAGVSFHITTTAPSSASLPADRGLRAFYAAFLPGLLGILFTAGSRRRLCRFRTWHAREFLTLLLVLGFSTLCLTSCGGSSGGGGGTSNPGTPAGTYQITVTATSGATTSTQMLNLVVQ
jgi:subtilase family serine protease